MQTESIGFWIGLISSVAGIVLSLVAIVFSILVDRRSSSVSDKTIQSLQKIESAVERSSSDTRELIKAGWDQMLSSVNRAPQSDAGAVSPSKEVAAGIAAELRAELTELSSAKGSTDIDEVLKKVEGIESYLSSLEASFRSQAASQRMPASTEPSLAEMISKINQLSVSAFALLRALSRYHLTTKQYRALTKGQYSSALTELRETGFIVPVVHSTEHGPEPCYYFPSESARIIRAAIHVLPGPSRDVANGIDGELHQLGYKTDRLN